MSENRLLNNISLLHFLKLAIFVVLIHSVSLVSGHSTGAPAETCTNMDPSSGHTGTTAANGNGPFKITITPEDQLVGQKVKIALITTDKKPFKGVFIQVRDKTDKNKALGSFKIPKNFTNKYKTIACHGGKDNAVTHSNADEVKNLEVDWIPAAAGKYVVYYTVVQDYSTYYVYKENDHSFSVLAKSAAPLFLMPYILLLITFGFVIMMS